MKPKTIEEYIYSAPAEAQERLWKLHDCIRSAAPGAIPAGQKDRQVSG